MIIEDQKRIKMEAKELMIGDWVYNSEHNIKSKIVALAKAIYHKCKIPSKFISEYYK